MSDNDIAKGIDARQRILIDSPRLSSRAIMRLALTVAAQAHCGAHAIVAPVELRTGLFKVPSLKPGFAPKQVRHHNAKLARYGANSGRR